MAKSQLAKARALVGKEMTKGSSTLRQRVNPFIKGALAINRNAQVNYALVLLLLQKVGEAPFCATWPK